jgi:hypothetical protein
MLLLLHCAQAADTVLLLQPSNVKALFRRGVARAAFGLLDGAKVSAQLLLLLTIANDSAYHCSACIVMPISISTYNAVVKLVSTVHVVSTAIAASN